MSLSLLDVVQLGVALLVTIGLMLIFLAMKKPTNQDSNSRFRRIVSMLSWLLIVFLAVDLGWLGGRWLGETQKPIKILSPAGGQAVDLRVFVTGRARIIPEGQELWMVVTPQGSGQYYPAAAKAIIQANGDWSSLAFIGSENDHGRTFDLLAVLVNNNAATILLENSQMGMPMLPSGCLVVDQISISRK